MPLGRHPHHRFAQVQSLRDSGTQAVGDAPFFCKRRVICLDALRGTHRLLRSLEGTAVQERRQEHVVLRSHGLAAVGGDDVRGKGEEFVGKAQHQVGSSASDMRASPRSSLSSSTAWRRSGVGKEVIVVCWCRGTAPIAHLRVSGDAPRLRFARICQEELLPLCPAASPAARPAAAGCGRPALRVGI